MPRDPGPPRGLLRPHPPAGRFVHERIAPADPRLAEHVAHVWWVAWDLRGLPAFTTQTLPHPTVHVVIEGRRADVLGVQTGAFTRRLAGAGRALGIKFRPAMAQPWLGAAASSITDRRAPVSRVFGRAARELVALARAAASPAEGAAAVEAFLAPRAPRPTDYHVAIRDLVERMAQDPSITRVEHAAALLGLDVRTLQRRFARLVGVGPKWVIQRYRLHEAAARLTSARPPSLAALAAELGYVDQAHFARDFKAVVGAPPSAYRAPTARDRATRPSTPPQAW